MAFDTPFLEIAFIALTIWPLVYAATIGLPISHGTLIALTRGQRQDALARTAAILEIALVALTIRRCEHTGANDDAIIEAAFIARA